MTIGNVAIKAEGLCKQYWIGKRQKYKALRDTLTKVIHAPSRIVRAMLSPSSADAASKTMIWALKNVSFEINQGEVVGVIGRNGAGKSTLLKILSRITEPTEGYADIHGRVGSLLEVGTGFHPELTGRENIYLNGSIIGMRKKEIDGKFDEIVDFAEIERFLDTPVKYYSSGMHMRLAFAVAAHLEPEILLVDEVLAVGDAAFQKKCLGKMGEVAKKGLTVLFVSHNMPAVRKLCQTAIFLEDGHVLQQGPVEVCVQRYLDQRGEAQRLTTHRILVHDPAVTIESVMINGSPYDQLDLSENDQCLEIEIIGTLARALHMEIEARLYDVYETPLAFFSPGHERGYADQFSSGRFSIVRRIQLPRLMRGEYGLSLYLTNPNVVGWVDVPQALRLRVAGSSTAMGRVFDCSEGRGWIVLSDATTQTTYRPHAGVETNATATSR